ncbi:hypothetical protein AXG93_3725s1010 [Marchantia polymorpha subsp. ruderalis]|uniref:Uncharacterized protein n=1 Tax=Marchantia polymorpha subsp. ruderalis TaxID=1480154 RepID=A0A176VU46_MARPO|nr:hypothetical protein AXG93_3725s1010 [Marchantia polymorpha subsp. ruderalis]
MLASTSCPLDSNPHYPMYTALTKDFHHRRCVTSQGYGKSRAVFARTPILARCIAHKPRERGGQNRAEQEIARRDEEEEEEEEEEEQEGEGQGEQEERVVHRRVVAQTQQRTAPKEGQTDYLEKSQAPGPPHVETRQAGQGRAGQQRRSARREELKTRAAR